MILYHANGEAFVLSPVVWRSALKLARSVGWQPKGTLPPPADLDRAPVMWNGAYDPAAGQQVSKSDAQALASSLKRALAADDRLGQELHLLAEFCCAGSFLICASPGITDSLASLVEHTGTGKSVSPTTRKIQTQTVESSPARLRRAST